jgi:hypothetical protein
MIAKIELGLPQIFVMLAAASTQRRRSAAVFARIAGAAKPG